MKSLIVKQFLPVITLEMCREKYGELTYCWIDVSDVKICCVGVSSIMWSIWITFLYKYKQINYWL